jgi:hypothetical protein
MKSFCQEKLEKENKMKKGLLKECIIDLSGNQKTTHLVHDMCHVDFHLFLSYWSFTIRIFS